MRDGLTAGLGIGLVLLVCGGTSFLVYKVIGGASPRNAAASSETASTEQPAKSTAGDPMAIGPADAGKYASALSTLQSIRAQCELFKLQHHDLRPDMIAFPKWELFTQKTDEQGRLNDRGPFGPYLARVPVNPLNGYSDVAVVDDRPSAGDAVEGSRFGFVFDRGEGRWWATDKSGQRVLDETITFDRPAASARAQSPNLSGRGPKPSAAEEKVAQLLTQLRALRTQVELYRFQHLHRHPNFQQYRMWEQLTGKTDNEGRITEKTPKLRRLPPGATRVDSFGPYLPEPPRNPLNGMTNVLEVEGPAHAGDAVASKGYGWVYSIDGGSLWATDETQQRILDEANPWPKNSPADRAAKRQSLMTDVQNLRSQIMVYKLQHAGHIPDAKQYPRWEQLTRTTDGAGSPVAYGRFGPYVLKTPVNPLNQKTEVELVDADPKPGQKAATPASGFVMHSRTGKVWALDENGVVILDY